MRILVALLVMLAGCASPAPSDDLVVPPGEPPAFEPVALVSGVVSWHWDEGTSFPAIFSAVYDPATQPIVHPCLFNEEPYFNNLPLSLKLAMQLVPVAADAVEVFLDWTDLDFRGSQLAIAYRIDDGAWQESPYIPRGGAILLEVPRAPANATGANETAIESASNSTRPTTAPGRPVAEEEPPSETQRWDVWVCLSRSEDSFVDSPAYSPEPFHGDLTARLTAVALDRTG
jgi:hypothetical protein